MMDEIERIKCRRFSHFKPSAFTRKYLIPIVAGFIIASPLPDEIGISMLAISKSVSTKKFAVISYLLNTGGIIAILLIGTSI
jgi:hypothetical protein